MYKRAEDTEEELEVELVEDPNSRQPLREEAELAIKELKVGEWEATRVRSHHNRDG